MKQRPASPSSRFRSPTLVVVGTLLAVLLSAAPGTAAEVGEERSHADETFAGVTFNTPALLSTGAAVVFQFDSITSSANMEETGFALDMLRQLRYISPVDTSRAVWDWNYVEIDAGIASNGRIALFSSPLANVAAIELRDGPSAEATYEIGIDNLWDSTKIEFMFDLSPLLGTIGLDPLSIDQQLFPYDEDGVAVSAAGGLLATTIDEPGGFSVSDTHLTLADASTLTVGDRLRIDSEVLGVSSVDANGVDATVVRASDGTAAAPHDDLRRVYAVEPRDDWFGSMITATTAAVDAVTTTLPVTLGGEFADGDIIRLIDETMVVSCSSTPCGNDLSVTRGAQGTTATAHPKSTPVKRFIPVAQWTLDSLADDAVERGAGSLDYSLVVDVPHTFLIDDLTFALTDAVAEFLTAGHLAHSEDIPVAFDQSIDVAFDTGLLTDRWTYTSRVWFDTEAGYDATVALFNDPAAFDPVALPLLLAGTSIYAALEIVHFTATCRPDASWANQDRQCITTVPTERDLSITLTDGTTSAVPGESLTYTLIAANDGLPHSDVQVSDAFPADLACTWTSASTGGATGNTAGSGDLADVLVMPALSSVTYTITCGIDPAATGTLVNTATISSPEGDFDPDNDSATDDDTMLSPAADLSITKTDGVTQAVPGASTTYTIVVANSSGPSTPADVLVTDTFPLSTACSWTSVATGDATGHSAGSGNLADVLTLPPGSTVTYSAVCAIDPAATGTLNNTATLASAADNTPTDNAATDVDTVLVPTADLAITNSNGVDSVRPGTTTTYTIVAQNAGPSLAVADVVDQFPATTTCSWTSVAAGGAMGNSDGSGNLADTLTLPPGSSVTYTALCAVDPAATGTLTNTATIASPVDSTPGNNTATDVDDLTPVPTFAKAFSPSDVEEGMPSTLTFTIDNTANALPVGDLAFTDDLPLGLRVAPEPNASFTCTGGTLLAAAHADSVSYSGGSVDGGARCTLSVDVLGARAGSYLNISSALTSSVGSGAVATATLVVRHRPRFAKSFLPDQILPGETSTLTFTIDNSAGTTAVTDLAFTDLLPVGMVVATPNQAVDGCAGSLDALAGSTSVSYAGGTVAASAVCTITLDVLGASAGRLTNQSSALSSSAGLGLGNGPPSFEWAVGINSSVSASAQSVAIDGADNVVYAGWFSGTADFDPGSGTANLTAGTSGDAFVAKLDANGDFVWAASATGTSGQSKGVAVDSRGDVLVSGHFRGETDFDPGPGTFLLDGGSVTNNAFVWKLDDSGNLAWVAALNEPLNRDDRATAVAVDADDNVYITGWFSHTSDFDPGPGSLELSSAGINAFVWKLDSGGNLVWARITNGSLGTVAQGSDLTLDDAGNVYVTGEFSGAVDFDTGSGTLELPNAGASDAFVWKLDSDGNFIWAVSAGGSQDDASVSIAVDHLGMVSCTGFFQGTVDFDPGPGVTNLTSNGGYDGFVMQLTDAGALSWVGSFGGSDDNFGQSITIDSSDNLHVSTLFKDTVDYDPGPDVFNLTASGTFDAAVVKLDAAGQFLSAGRLGGEAGDFTIAGTPRSIAVSDDESVLLVGFLNGTTDFDPGVGSAPLTSAGGAFVVRLGVSGATDTLMVDPVTDLAVTLSDSPDPVLAGQNLTYTAQVTNNGPSNSVGASVIVPLADVAFSSSSDCTETGGIVTCPIDPLDAGASQSVSFVVTLDPGQTAAIDHTATVTTSETDPVSSNDIGSSSTTVNAEADLAITLVDSPDPVIAGHDLTYTMAVTNNGPSASSGAVVTDALPTGMTFTSSQDCTASGSAVTCPIGALGLGASESVSFIVTVGPGQTAALNNTATILGNENDPVAGNDSASSSTTVDVEADLALEVEDSEDPIVGETFSYTLTVTNNGPSDASGGEVSGLLPAGLVFESSIDGCTEANGTVRCAFESLLAGQALSSSFVVALEPPFPATVTNTASVTGNELDPVPGNDTASEDTQLDAQPPTVIHLTTVNDTGDGELNACETTAAQITQFLMTFSEPVQDPPGDTDLDDVTNPNNYLLLSAGADRSFQTDQCGPAMGDDQSIEISTVTYDEESATATLTLASEALASDLYRLFACGSTSILDLGGNALDGDGDGIGGDDFMRLFRVDSENLLANGHFDCDLGSWLTMSTIQEEVAHGNDDLDASADSGSATIENLTASINFSLGQCLAISPLTAYDFEAGTRLATTSREITARLTCSFYRALECTGAEISPPSTSTTLLGDTGTTWVRLGSALTAPAGSQSTLCSIDLVTATGASFEAHVDQVRLVVDDEIFADDFESGNISSWSASVP